MASDITLLYDTRPIGVLDSGVGGLSVLREIRALLPHEHILYAADQGHVPYGPRSIEEVRTFTLGVARFLIEHKAKLVVVACNTASAAALYTLREAFPETPFVGMEPAVKPAARDTRTGRIGVIATEATFQGELYASVVGRFANGVQVETQACPEFVLLAEAGETSGDAAREAVRRRLAPLLAAGIDQLVLGCTHFPFLRAIIEAEVGPGVCVIDPGAAIARQVRRVLDGRGLLNGSDAPGGVTYTTSGDPAAFRRVLNALLGIDTRPDDVLALRWNGGLLGWAE
ncbi:glutamate racemase [Aggregatilinea lenta]|uniref:glutamate racemase n=1 Tax=Aggregatilinea lenta TaxID=913108 RepID=UPI000E5A3B84|nr:glutamate racemase [Aggregatilinea lenta]